MANESKKNLDKICAQYGMDLLNIPKALYEKSAEIIKNIPDKNNFLSTNFNFNDGSEKNINDFFEYKLINPLENMKSKIQKVISDKNKQKEIYENLKSSPLKFTSKEFETEITKALSILIEDGPFAYIIWLKSQDKEPRRAMLIQTARLLLELNIIADSDISPKEDLEQKIEEIFLTKISNNLTTLFLVKTVLEKMLIYARYKAKAMQHE